MKALVQRVSEASVTVQGAVVGAIGPGLLILFCALEGDGEEAADFLAGKVAKLRIFEDEAGKMNRSLLDCGGAALVVSQFTLAADCRQGQPAQLCPRGRARTGGCALPAFLRGPEVKRHCRRDRTLCRCHEGCPGQRRPGDDLAGHGGSAMKRCRAMILLFGGLVLTALLAQPAQADPRDDLVTIPAGKLNQGDAGGEPDEVVRTVQVAAFRIMRHEVTNDLFERFVAESGYRSDVERKGWGWVWPLRWEKQEGADWRRPAGPDSSIDGLAQHPVVQISQQDAAAFCAAYGLRLPSDAEWEYAARGRDRRRYPWGEGPPETASGERRANFGQIECCAADDKDGYGGTAPVGSFPSGRSPFGLLDMAGNVWEWTSTPYPPDPAKVTLRGGGWGNNPYCLRVSYRHGNPPDVGLDMVGFRCAADAAAG